MLKRVADEYPPVEAGPGRWYYCNACQAAWQPAPGDWAWWGARNDALVIDVAGEVVLVELCSLTRHVVPRSHVLLNKLQVDAARYALASDSRHTQRAWAIRKGVRCPPELTLAEALASAGVEYALPKALTEAVSIGDPVSFNAQKPDKPRQLRLW